MLQNNVSHQPEQKHKPYLHTHTRRAMETKEAYEEIRIVLFGKTGVGKSASGNTILREEAFRASIFASSETETCHKVTKEINGKKVAVIDTPGLFNTRNTLEEAVNRIKLCIPLSAPGPHAFLLVVQPGRFTQEDKQTVEIFMKIFGEDASNYMVVLFTHGDKLGKISIQEFVSMSPDLVRILKNNNNQHHVFNNEDKDSTQVDELLEKISVMVTKNGGGCYTNKMLQMAEQAIEEEKQQIMKQNEEQHRRLLESLKQEALFESQKELWDLREKEAREQAEKNNKYITIVTQILWEIFEKIITKKGNTM